jgi:5'-nucleotidase/UDP-sugar diphosphatase
MKSHKNVFLVLFAAVLLVFSSGCVAQKIADTRTDTADEFRMTVIHLNDTHSHVDAMTLPMEFNGKKTYVEIGGFPRLVSGIEEARAIDPDALLLMAGDAVQGTLYFTKYEGSVEAEFMDMMGFDVMVTGNHEFDKGPAWLAGFISEVDFPVIAANIDTSRDEHLTDVIGPYVVKDIDGHTVGIIGLVTPDTPETSMPGKNVIFYDQIARAKKMVKELEKAGVNKIIALTHLGYECDKDLARRVKGIDIVIGGHTHTLLGDFDEFGLTSEGPYPTTVTGPDGHDVCVAQAWRWGIVLGRLTVQFDKDGVVTECSGHPSLLVGDTFLQKDDSGKKVEVDEAEQGRILDIIKASPMITVVQEDAAALALRAPYKEGIEDMQTEVVAEIGDDLWHVRVPGTVHEISGETMRHGSYLAPIVADSMLWKARSTGRHIHMAIENAGGVRTSLKKGALTVGKVYELFPFGNTLVILKLTGKQVKAILEQAVSRASVPDKDGAFPYVAGIRYRADMTQPENKRILSVEIKGADDRWEPIGRRSVYTVAVNSYLAHGGDGYEILKEAASSCPECDTGFNDAEIFMEYTQGHSPLHRLRDTGITYIPAE